MRTLVLIGLAVLAAGCAGSEDAVPDGKDGVAERRSDHELILDAVLQDILVRPENQRLREFYGTPGGKLLALASDSPSPWPPGYRPAFPGYRVEYRAEGRHLGGAHEDRVLGVRVDAFLRLSESGLEIPYIYVTVFNLGGSRNGGVIGGCSLVYEARRKNRVWEVICVLDDDL